MKNKLFDKTATDESSQKWLEDGEKRFNMYAKIYEYEYSQEIEPIITFYRSSLFEGLNKYSKTLSDKEKEAALKVIDELKLIVDNGLNDYLNGEVTLEEVKQGVLVHSLNELYERNEELRELKKPSGFIKTFIQNIDDFIEINEKLVNDNESDTESEGYKL